MPGRARGVTGRDDEARRPQLDAVAIVDRQALGGVMVSHLSFVREHVLARVVDAYSSGDAHPAVMFVNHAPVPPASSKYLATTSTP